MKITEIETFVVHCPVTGDGIADAVHSITHWGAPGVVIRTDAGIEGYGFAGTHAHIATDRLITSCIADAFGPLLVGADANAVESLWDTLDSHPPIRWVGRAGITTLAHAAIDIALWDIRAKAAGLPLWQLLGGDPSRELRAYTTDAGWMDRTMDELVGESKRLVDEYGYSAVKVKVGHDNSAMDMRRVEAVRNGVGDNVAIMTDANGKWSLPEALRAARGLADLGVTWLEEPLFHDDVFGHAELAASATTPIALGEQLYSPEAFATFVRAGAVHWLQPDVTRLSGITPFRRVAELAASHRLGLVAHAGDMAQVHSHLSIAHAHVSWLEYIPWLREAMSEPVQIVDGKCVIPSEPGAGTTLRPDALERFGVR